jgi:redox-sensitive bicupin YhaK (pirin superfamily)
LIRVRKAGERGHFDHGWLDTYHTFSFGDSYDPAHLGFRSLRGINDDRVQPGQRFGIYGYRDMESVTCDGAAISAERQVTVVGEQGAEVMLFDLA